MKNLVMISGGGFSTEKQSYIDEFALGLCQKREKRKVVFVPTASHDATGYIEKFMLAFADEEPASYLVKELADVTYDPSVDLIYIGGGETGYMMDAWRENGFDQVLLEHYHKGTVMVGISAGAMCWFEQLYEDGRVSMGLGVLEGSLCPHYGADEESADYDQWAATQPQLTHYRLKNEENLHLWHGERLVAINVQEVPYAE